MSLSTKQRLIALLDEADSLLQQLRDLLVTANSKSLKIDVTDIVNSLIVKDAEIKICLEDARKQVEIRKRNNVIERELSLMDDRIFQFQDVLKETETILANAVHQAKTRLPQADSNSFSSSLNGGAIGGGVRAKVSIEDVVQLAHRISAQHSSAAPHNIALAAGDPRRPYPNDAEMRAGFLGHNATTAALSGYCAERASSAGLDLSTTASAPANSGFGPLSLGGQQSQTQVAIAVNVPSRGGSAAGLAEGISRGAPSSPAASFRQPAAAAADSYDVAYMSSGEESD